ncbi:MAG: hypothetical protein QHJ34_03145 [bacterium]|nr:hypothetical protein [candidate division KSB1 bacterium]MDH7559212.1 hypothetical protein [bacterium]
MELELEIDGNTHHITLHKEGNAYLVTVDGKTMRVACQELTPTSRLLTRDSRTRLVYLVCQGGDYQVCISGCGLTVKRATRLSAEPGATGRPVIHGG